MLLTATIAACGGLMIAAKLSTPNMPMLETVKVPPWYSSGFNPPRGRALARSFEAAEMAARLLLAASLMTGVMRPSVERDRHRHVHLLVQLDALGGPESVEVREVP